MRQYGVPPPSVTIAIGKMVDDWTYETGEEHLEPERPPFPKVFLVPGAYTGHMVFKNLCVQTVGQVPWYYRPITPEIESGGRLVQIWPPREDVVDWPPAKVIDGPTSKALGTMWACIGPPPPDPWQWR